jgi:threonine aldolase
VEGLRRRGWHFYTFIGSGGARFMCSWETREEDIEALAADLREAAQEG